MHMSVLVRMRKRAEEGAGSLETLHTAAEVLQSPEHMGLSARLARGDWQT